MNTDQNHSRRNFIKTGSLLAFGGILVPSFARHTNLSEFSSTHTELQFALPSLPYAYEALEPFIDRQTMQLHHDKHHQAYIDNLNKALKEEKKLPADLVSLLKKISKYPKVIKNNAGGHYNHSMFWKLMKPNGGGQPTGALANAINSSFGSFDAFKTSFTETSIKHFGSGWAWLALKKNKLEIGTTDNQDNPLMDCTDFKGIPVLGLDVWEHAYYLKYQNKRPEYINAWWNVVNWEEAGKNYDAAVASK